MRQLIVSIEVPLPCGCTIVARDATQTPVGSTPIDPQRVMQALNFGSGTLAYWYRHFAGRHHCHLVTPQNPNGIDPDAPKGAHQTPVGSTPIDPQRVMQAVNFGSGTLAYWYRYFSGIHRCHLVTPQNHNGIDHGAPKGAHPAPLMNLSDTELDLLAEVDHAPFIVAANLSTPHAPHELEHLIELGLIGDPGETGALVTTDAGKATVKARR